MGRLIWENDDGKHVSSVSILGYKSYSKIMEPSPLSSPNMDLLFDRAPLRDARQKMIYLKKKSAETGVLHFNMHTNAHTQNSLNLLSTFGVI